MSTTVFRVEKSREFVVMNNRFLRNKEMSLKAKGLLALCLSLPEDWNYSLNGLVAICKESHTSIRSTLKELEQFNHLRREKTKDSKGQFVYEYIIYEIPYESISEPHTENLYMDNLYTDNLHIENNIQQSIEEEIIEEQNIDNTLYISEQEEIILKNVDNMDLVALYKQYLEMRKSINAPLTPRGMKMLITRCVNLSHNSVKVQKLILENAIINRWKNVYRPSEQEVEAALNAELQNRKSVYGL